ncbi:GNAT family N-acetyltransferase [Marinomonas sp. C2222]|uniref:GNAT family N-acetyltransferase n=1 Tax=Marinomonas sargassi TaxID=2984494 RepID=A0ABT2YU18_9GAMM|nr:GNAT family N-acetyltransferase [Marinomonas sargassi]MCV2403396.1 GNAT family N-acetyltransferase [Marinomonas sargassi]
MSSIIVRKWRETDDISKITALLHRAYKELADMGFKYYATWQGDEVTRKRLSAGVAFIAEKDGNIVGTGTLYFPSNTPAGCDWYDRDDVAKFGQFAVDPDYQGCGIGSKMLEEIENTARKKGFPNLALDTAEGAHHLIKMYGKRGFKLVDYADWDKTNYRSVIMNKSL